MSTFALDRVTHTVRLDSKGGAASRSFGPPTQGPIRVVISATQVVDLPLVGGRPIPPSPVPLSLLGVTADVGLIDFGSDINRPGDVSTPLPGGPIAASAFQVELLDARDRLRASSQGNLQFELSSPSLGAPQPMQFPGSGPPWTIRIVNHSNFRAEVTAHIEFQGVRPIVTREFDIAEIQRELIGRLFPDPVEISIENRTVAEITAPGSNLSVPILHSFLVVENAINVKANLALVLAGAGIDVDLSKIPSTVDLGGRIFTETVKARLELNATIHDGDLALKVRPVFRGALGAIDLIAVLRAMGVGTGKRLLAQIGISLSGSISRINKIQMIDADLFLVLRSRGFFGRPLRGGPHFQVIAKTRIDLEGDRASQLAEGAANVLLERFLPEALGESGIELARMAIEGLAGRENPEIAGSEQKLTLLFAGDPPSPEVLAPRHG